MNKQKLIKKVNDGLSTRKLALHFNKSQSTIKYWLIKYKLKTKYNKYNKRNSKPYLCKCGESNPKNFYGKKLYICGKCHNKITLKNNRKKRRYILNKLGNRCKHCGFSKFKCALDLHHINPKIKDKNSKSILGWSLKRIDKEIKDCILLCKNCHSAYHTKNC